MPNIEFCEFRLETSYASIKFSPDSKNIGVLPVRLTCATMPYGTVVVALWFWILVKISIFRRKMEIFLLLFWRARRYLHSLQISSESIIYYLFNLHGKIEKKTSKLFKNKNGAELALGAKPYRCTTWWIVAR